MAEDQLRLSPEWGQRVEDGTALAPLLALDEALELSNLRRGISRDAFLKDLLRDLHHQQLIPLLMMLPRRWKVGQASLPEHLRTIGNLLETGLISPLLLATLADDLQHLLPPSPKGQQRGAIDRWSERHVALSDHHTVPLPESLDALETISATDLAGPAEDSKPGTLAKISALGGTLCWRNQGLPSLQSERAKRRNRVIAQVLNALGSNRLPSMPGASKTGGSTPYQFCGVSSGRALLQHLQALGWQCRARIRASVASFGLGASTHNGEHWQQIPLAVPYRTGLLDANGEEIRALLPHCSLEMELQPPNPEADTVLVQYYQGTEGLNGWAALNDQHRPWQNDRSNGTVAYPTDELRDQPLEEALDLCELMGAVHNSEAQFSDLHGGGYGALASALTPPPWWSWPSPEPPACFLSRSATFGDSDCFASSSSFLRQGLRHPTAAWIATATASSSCPRISSTPAAHARMHSAGCGSASPVTVRSPSCEPSTVRHRGCREVRALQFPTDGFHHLAAVCHRKGA